MATEGLAPAELALMRGKREEREGRSSRSNRKLGRAGFPEEAPSRLSRPPCAEGWSWPPCIASTFTSTLGVVPGHTHNTQLS